MGASSPEGQIPQAIAIQRQPEKHIYEIKIRQSYTYWSLFDRPKCYTEPSQKQRFHLFSSFFLSHSEKGALSLAKVNTTFFLIFRLRLGLGSFNLPFLFCVFNLSYSISSFSPHRWIPFFYPKSSHLTALFPKLPEERPSVSTILPLGFHFRRNHPPSPAPQLPGSGG